MTRVTPILIVTIFLTSLLFVPSVFVFGGSNALANIDASPESQALLSQTPHNARVAIYDEDNLTAPVISHASDLTNNLAEITTLLEGAGHSVEAITEEDILNHVLITANYDVFVIVNNVPRPSIEHLVKEFSMGGGGLLTMNSAVSYLWYGGYIFTDQDYDVGYGTWWGYWASDSQTITSRHSTMTDYHVDDIVYERAENWATSWEPKLLEGRGDDMIFLMHNASSTDFITAFAIDNKKDGGRIVQLPGDGLSIPTAFENIIIDSVEWLIPKPKGRIVYDLTHQPRLCVDEWDEGLATIYNADNSFTQFRTLAVNHTYTFDKLYPSATGNLTAERLADYDVLMIGWPDLEYATAEYAAVEEWVNGGGSLLVLGDRTGFGGSGNTYINTLLQNFDMSLGTTDVLDFSSMTPGTHLTLEGCSSLAIGYRNYLNVMGTATSIWFDGSDTVVAGQEFGQGRAILSADMNIFDNFDLHQESNAKFALNVLNWLTAAQAEVLIFLDYSSTGHWGYHSGISDAMNSLGVPYQLITSTGYLDDFIGAQSWDLVVVDVPNYGLTTADLDVLESFVDNNGSLIMSHFDMDGEQTHTLWPKIGIAYVSDILAGSNITIWESSHPIFNLPNDYGETHFYPYVAFADDGDVLTATGGATALAGITATAQADNALIVLSNGSRVLYNGYLFDEMEGDLDDSTYSDHMELWENEIAFMLRPTIDSPSDFNFTTGSLNNEVVWHGDSYYPSHYEILQNGTSVSTGEWNGSGIAFSLDGVAVGVYEYQITVYDITGNYAMDAVIVTVLPGLLGGIDPLLLIGIGIAAVAVILVFAFVLRQRGAGGAGKPKPKKKTTKKKK